MSRPADSDAFELYRQGLKLHRAKDYAGAVALLERAVAADGQMADAWEALGVLYDKLNRLDDAITATERFAALRPDEVMAHTNLSRFFQKKGMKERAEEEQGKARLIGWKQELAQGGGKEHELAQSAPPPGAAEAAPQLVSMIGGLGGSSAPTAAGALKAGATAPLAADGAALQKKIEQFEKLVAHNAADTLSRFTLGRAYLEAGRADDAARVLEETLALKPDFTAAYVLLGEAYEKAGKLARALKTWNKGVEIAQQKGDLHPRNQMQEHLKRVTGGPAGAESGGAIAVP
ncbi:MAG TPA: tetratricopeptide repeat protein [Planctomycetota bacterium]|nr:tetratricopeptide repeat protein [Planctomycetota bacterium]